MEGGAKDTTKPRSQLFLKVKHETLQPALTFTHAFTHSMQRRQVRSVTDAVPGAESTVASLADTVPALMSSDLGGRQQARKPENKGIPESAKS